ncbi:MAG: hypothetical protein AAF485_22885 [Chloroflexota bacterium]
MSTWSKLSIILSCMVVGLLVSGCTKSDATEAPQQNNQFTCQDVIQIPQQECEALVALYQSLDGANWTNQGGWLSGNTPCGWSGVTCSTPLVAPHFCHGRPVYAPVNHKSLWAYIENNPIYQHIFCSSPPCRHYETRNIDVQIVHLCLDGLHVKSLRLSYKKLKNPLPSEIGQLAQLTQLEDLFLDGNGLTHLPPEIGQLTQLRTLSLNRNNLTSLPPEIGLLDGLWFLELNDNQIITLPSTLSQLDISWLELNNNGLTTLPLAVTQLKQLKYLKLNDNNLTHLPPEIGDLKTLRSLELDNNHLSALPSTFPQLTNLASIHLENNHFVVVPAEFTRLDIKYLFFDGNPVTIPSSQGDP